MGDISPGTQLPNTGLSIPDTYDNWAEAFIAVAEQLDKGPLFTGETQAEVENKMTNFFDGDAGLASSPPDGTLGFAYGDGAFYVWDSAQSSTTEANLSVDMSQIEDNFLSSEQNDRYNGDVLTIDGGTVRAVNGGTIDASDGTLILPTS